MQSLNARIAGAAAGLILEQRTKSLKIDPLKLSYSYNIVFDTMQSYCEKTADTMNAIVLSAGSNDGLTIKTNYKSKLYIVLYNHRVSNSRKAFTLAHEIGHIYLNHQDDCTENESQANYFASNLLAPRILLYELKKRFGALLRYSDICDIFTISAKAARVALNNVPTEGFDKNEWELLAYYRSVLPTPAKNVSYLS